MSATGLGDVAKAVSEQASMTCQSSKTEMFAVAVVAINFEWYMPASALLTPVI